MCQAQEAQLPTSAAQTSQHDASELCANSAAIRVAWRKSREEHAQCGEQGEEKNAPGVWYRVDEVGRRELDKEGGDNVGEKDDSFWYVRTDQIEGCGEDDHVEDVVDQACRSQ